MKTKILPVQLSLTGKYYSINLFWLISILLISVGNYVSAQGSSGMTFMVSQSGSDNNPGTRSQPFATLEAARDAARRAGPGDHRIIVRPGEYYLSSTTGT